MIKNFCLFIGPVRCGSTLLAAILDSHKNICMANEARIIRCWNINHILAKLFDNNYHFSKYKNIWTNNKYYIPNSYQGETIINNAATIGNKCGGTSSIFLSNLYNLKRFIKTISPIELKFIYLIRNPFDNIISMNNINKKGIDFNIDAYFDRHKAAHILMEQCNTYTILIENFLYSYHYVSVLKEILKFFNVEESFGMNYHNITKLIKPYNKYSLIDNFNTNQLKKINKETKQLKALRDYYVT